MLGISLEHWLEILAILLSPLIALEVQSILGKSTSLAVSRA